MNAGTAPDRQDCAYARTDPSGWEEELPPGAMWSAAVGRWREVRLTALDAGANVSALAYRLDDPLDRLNIPDTLKALKTAKLTRGHVLMSDMGHAMLSIVEDTLGWHDPLGGHITGEQVEAKFGALRYADARNKFHRNARDNFLVELGKRGLGERDLVANANFFSRVRADADGRLAFDAGHCVAGSRVVMRAEMPVLVVLSNTPHPMHPPGGYPQARVRVEVRPGAPRAEDDFCRNFRPECARAMALADRLFV